MTCSRKGRNPPNLLNDQFQWRQTIKLAPSLLFCWILDVSNWPFSISIEDTRTVGHLKEIPVAFANVDPFELTLWKVCNFLRFDQFLATFHFHKPQESITIDRRK